MCNIDVKSIYKITNNINGKIYIGQAKSIKNRFQQHCSPSSKSAIGLAIKKYGKNNFSFEVIEKDIKNYDEREIYWIAFYNSISPNGYNILEGGQGKGKKSLTGENAGTAIYTEKQIEQVRQDLLNSNLSYSEILEKNKINNVATIGYINNGTQWPSSNYIYPIREKKNIFIQSKVPDIITMLLEGKTEKEIENVTLVGHSLIDKINKGSAYRQDNIKYPIRTIKDVKKSLYEEIHNIQQDLMYSEMSIEEISKKYNSCLSRIYNINNGVTGKNSCYNYPLRTVNNNYKEIHRRLDKEKIKEIIDYLNFTELSFKEISQITNVGYGQVARINTGKSYKQENQKYPIRKKQ